MFSIPTKLSTAAKSFAVTNSTALSHRPQSSKSDQLLPFMKLYLMLQLHSAHGLPTLYTLQHLAALIWTNDIYCRNKILLFFTFIPILLPIFVECIVIYVCLVWLNYSLRFWKFRFLHKEKPLCCCKNRKTKMRQQLAQI